MPDSGNKQEVPQKLARIMRDVFDDDALVVTPEMSAADVEEWDSLSNVRLILSIEREFRIKFAASEVIGLKNVGELTDLVQSKFE